MNYNLHYNLLIEKSKNRNRPDICERHHILPKSMGGNNKKENIVYLTPKEHYVAHHLLWKIHRNREMYYAFWCMLTRMGRNKETFRVTGRLYEQSKIHHKAFSSELHRGKIPWNKGKTNIYSEESLIKMSEARIGFIESIETRKKKSASHTGVKKGPSPLKGKPAPFNEKWFVICPYCGKQGIEWNMKRYHFENCKKLKEIENLY